MRRLANAVFAAAFFLLIPISARAAGYLVPVGKLVGLQLRDNTVTVAAFDDASGSRAKNAGLRIGDQIIRVNGQSVDCPEDVRMLLSKTSGPVALTIRRGSKESQLYLTPEDDGDGPKLGVYLRQGISGVGTVTWFDPESGRFGALGHGVSTSKDCLLQMTSGSVYSAEVLSAKKGCPGTPGLLRGQTTSDIPFGTLTRNTPQGVFGVTSQHWEGTPLPVAQWEDISVGPASIRSTISGGQPREYSVEILKIYPKDRANGRNFLLKVTDPALLRTTGGIVQGMSGSPIIQDGKLVGAVTHVLVNQPDTGYGIFIENMLDAAG